MRLALGLASAASLLLGAVPAPAQSHPLDAALLTRVDSLARQEADANLLSGIILVARGDQVLLQRGYGYENRESRAPIGAGTRFGIGSITKVMTETLVALLVTEGRLELDAPVSKYLGPFPTGPAGGTVTVRHLLDHRSGVPHRVTSESDETQPLHPSEIVDRVRARGLLFEPGTAEVYSSAGFTCLARVIEVVEGMPFDAVLRDRIFRPASMAGATDETGPLQMAHRALPYRLGASGTAVTVFDAPYKHLGFLAGAGSLYATAEDLLHLVRAMKNGTFGAAGRSQVAETSDRTWRSWYGRAYGYEASVDYDPVRDVTLVLLSNLRSAATWQLREQVRNVLLGRSPAAIARPPAVAATFEPPESVLGSYGDPVDPIVISLIGTHLFRDENEIYPIANGRYYLPASGSVMWLRRSPDGRVESLITLRPSSDRESVALRVSSKP